MDQGQNDISKYTEHPGVKKVLSELNKRFDASRPLHISDVYTEDPRYPNGLQFVNLVQEEGGVLGIGLVGYTWLLEQMGIRFYSLAGTSAGAINTMLLASMGDAREEKSTKILKKLNQKDLFDFIDGHWLAKVLIRRFFTKTGYLQDIKRDIIILSIGCIGVPLLATLLVAFFGDIMNDPTFRWLFGGITIVSWLTLILLLSIAMMLKKKFFRSGYGINPGNTFEKWVSEILEENGAQTLSLLQKKMEVDFKNPEKYNSVEKLNLKIRQEGSNDKRTTENLPRKLAIIASDITCKSKIEFPAMAPLYWKDTEQVNPAQFVRASMSIPIFFEAHEVRLSREDNTIKEAWKNFQNVEKDTEIPRIARFVDGGMISNFPINIFHNPNVSRARLPTLGVKLDEIENHKEGGVQHLELEEEYTSLGAYIWGLFNTVRYYYDKDFLLRNRLYNTCIGVIDTTGFNWLNFNIKEDEKIKLFVRGVQAAGEFLQTFDWENYKEERSKLMEKMNPS